MRWWTSDPYSEETKMIVNIVGGNGTMGRVHKPILEASGHRVIISGRNSSPGIEEATVSSDVTIVSVPIRNAKEVIERVGRSIREGSALIDFTSVKVHPMNWMLRSFKGEVTGIHPLYGEMDSIKGLEVVYCIGRNGDKTPGILDSFRRAGAELLEYKPHEHDFQMGYVQVLRVDLLDAFGAFLGEAGLGIDKILKISPPPTKRVLELLAKQAHSGSDEMYLDMARFNPFVAGIRKSFVEYLSNRLEKNYSGEEVRRMLDKRLEELYQKGKSLVKLG